MSPRAIVQASFFAGGVACALALAGCKACEKDTPAQADGGHAQSTVLTAEQSAQVLATVGDETPAPCATAVIEPRPETG